MLILSLMFNYAAKWFRYNLQCVTVSLQVSLYSTVQTFAEFTRNGNEFSITGKLKTLATTRTLEWCSTQVYHIVPGSPVTVCLLIV